VDTVDHAAKCSASCPERDSLCTEMAKIRIYMSASRHKNGYNG
jgi:hypothetical protein